MQLKEAIEHYGEQKIEEILDMIMFNVNSWDKWREVAVKTGIVKKTTKTIKPWIIKEHVKVELKRDEEGRLDWYKIDNPYHKIRLRLENGRGQEVFELRFETDESGKIKGV